MVARTEVDIKSTLLRDILLDINKDVEGLELHKSPPRVCRAVLPGVLFSYPLIRDNARRNRI